MKRIIIILLFILPFIGFSQNINRVLVNGEVIVESDDIEGIAVFNTNTKKGTITNAEGKFTIEAGVDDVVEIKALKFENINVLINESIVKTKRLRIFLIEEITQLDEVVVAKNKLSGNLEVDVENSKTFSPKLNVLYFGMHDDPNMHSQQTSKLTNVALHSQANSMIHGLNIINVVDLLLLPLFRSEASKKDAVEIPEVPGNSIKYYFGSQYLVENFNIPEYRVEEFIRFVEDDKFDYTLLNYGREMEFLEVINMKSKTFLNKKRD